MTRGRLEPLRFQDGELIPWGPAFAVRLLCRGLMIGERRIGRRKIMRTELEALRAWFRWTTALPGDRFWDFPRNLIVEVAHGAPKHRTVRIVTADALRYRSVRDAGGVSAVLALTPPEPCPYTWHDLLPWKESHR